MEKREASKGQAVLEVMAAWVGSWVVFPESNPGLAILAALWALHTWFAARWPATTYAFATSAGPGCGKSTLLEVLLSVSKNGRFRQTMRALAVVRDIEETKGEVTYFFDQVEALRSPKITDEVAILLGGYRKGGEHGISVGPVQVAFSTYCPKFFGSIGAMNRDLMSRVMAFPLTYGVPSRVWTDAVMTREDEATRLRAALHEALPLDSTPDWVPPSWLQGRNREIYTPLWSVAMALGVDDAMAAKIRQAIDIAILQKAETEEGGEMARYRSPLPVAAREAVREYGPEALRDLAAVLPVPGIRGKVGVPTGDMSTVAALAAMKARNVGWQLFRGVGLDAMALAGLLERFGVKPTQVRERRGRAAKNVSGYRRDEVLGALAKLG